METPVDPREPGRDAGAARTPGPAPAPVPSNPPTAPETPTAEVPSWPRAAQGTPGHAPQPVAPPALSVPPAAPPSPVPSYGPLVAGRRDPGEQRPAGPLAINARYFALRVLIFGAVLTTVLVVGIDAFPLGFVLAVVVSGLVSYPLALRQRREVIAALERRRGWVR